jgi:hypothetical protein
MTRATLLGVLLFVCGCPATPAVKDAGASADDADDRAMRAYLGERLKMPPEVVARLRRLDKRLHCGEYVDDARGVGFIVSKKDGVLALDAMGSPPKPTTACQTYDDFVQGQKTSP